jgi:hypothetical protein
MLITECVVDWAKKSFIYNENLIREMFHLVYRQYNSLGEVKYDIIVGSKTNKYLLKYLK